MPLFSILFFILSLGNCGVPLTLNFVGEFLSLYGVFERLPLLGVFASSSIIFSAAYTIYMFNRIAFAGSYSKFFNVNIIDLNKREFYILLVLVVFTVVLGIYPAPILDGLHYSISSLVYILPVFLNKRLKESEIKRLKNSIAHIRLRKNDSLEFIRELCYRLTLYSYFNMSYDVNESTEEQFKMVLDHASSITLSNKVLRFNSTFKNITDCKPVYENLLKQEIKKMDNDDFILEKKIKELAKLEPNFTTLPEDSLWSKTKHQYMCLCVSNIPLKTNCFDYKITYLKPQKAKFFKV